MNGCPTPEKAHYYGKRSAKQAARRALSHGKHLKAYRCRCGCYHLTSGKSRQPASERLGDKLKQL